MESEGAVVGWERTKVTCQGRMASASQRVSSIMDDFLAPLALDELDKDASIKLQRLPHLLSPFKIPKLVDKPQNPIIGMLESQRGVQRLPSLTLLSGELVGSEAKGKGKQKIINFNLEKKSQQDDRWIWHDLFNMLKSSKKLIK